MSDYETLKEKLARTPWLIADVAGQTVELVTNQEERAIQKERDEDFFPFKLCVNLAQSLERFADHVGKEDRHFTMDHVSQISRKGQMIRIYDRRGVLTPTDGRAPRRAFYTWADAFAGGTIGFLSNCGFKMEVLRQILPMLRGGTARNQTPRKVEASVES